MSTTDYPLPPLPSEYDGTGCYSGRCMIDYGIDCAEAARAPLLAERDRLRAEVEALQNIRSTLHRNGWATDQADAALRAAGVATKGGLEESP